MWRAYEQPKALYARGSATLPMGSLVHHPWDMDFVLFVAKDEDLATRIASLTMTKMRSGLPNLPPPDITVVRDDCTAPETLYMLLLISLDGVLLRGENRRFPITYFVKHQYTIWQYALKICKLRLISFDRCSDPREQQKRAPHLAKALLRLGGLLELQDGGFTRNPKECAGLLNRIYPQTKGSSIVLLRCLEVPIEANILSDACHHILIVVSRENMNDQRA